MSNWLQKIYDSIKNFTPPQWIKSLMQSLNDLIISIATQVGQSYLDYLKTEIIYAAGQNWSPKEKFDYVFKQAKKGFLEFSVTLKDNEINSIINLLVSVLKKQGVIK